MIDHKKIEEAIASGTISFIDKVYFFGEMESTNDFARKSGGECDFIVLTDYQTGGRGRFDRSWLSEEGSNLTFTVKKRINLADSKFQYVNFIISCSIFEAVKEVLDIQMYTDSYTLSLKWPNDVLLNGRKLSGILIETIFNKKEFIIGAGVNVNQVSFDESIAENTISLKQAAGKDFDCTDLLMLVLKKFEMNMSFVLKDSFEPLFEKWKSYHKYLGKMVKFATAGNTSLTAQVIDFQDDGAIKLALGNKEIVYYSGDIRILDTFPS